MKSSQVAKSLLSEILDFNDGVSIDSIQIKLTNNNILTISIKEVLADNYIDIIYNKLKENTDCISRVLQLKDINMKDIYVSTYFDYKDKDKDDGNTSYCFSLIGRDIIIKIRKQRNSVEFKLDNPDIKQYSGVVSIKLTGENDYMDIHDFIKLLLMSFDHYTVCNTKHSSSRLYILFDKDTNTESRLSLEIGHKQSNYKLNYIEIE